MWPTVSCLRINALISEESSYELWLTRYHWKLTSVLWSFYGTHLHWPVSTVSVSSQCQRAFRDSRHPSWLTSSIHELIYFLSVSVASPCGREWILLWGNYSGWLPGPHNNVCGRCHYCMKDCFSVSVWQVESLMKWMQSGCLAKSVRLKAPFSHTCL